MLRVSLHDLWSRKRRLLGMSFAVLLGVAFLSGTLVLSDTMRGGFDDLFSKANADTDVVVRSTSELEGGEVTQTGLLDASLADRIDDVDGVAAVAPRVLGVAQIVGADGEPIGGNGPPTLGGNWVTDPGPRPWQLAEGRAPRAADEVVIDRRAADLGDLQVGSRTIVQTPTPVKVTVVGLARFGSEDSLAGATFVGFTTDAAERLLTGGTGKVSSIAVAGEPGVGQAELARRVEHILPSGTEAITGAQLTSEQRDDIDADFLDLFETFLLVFAGIALLVATLSIYNAFSILVAQRTRESALLRAVGASRRQVLASVAVEALLVGLAASLVGAAVGIALAGGLRALLDALGLSLPGGPLAVEPTSLAIAVFVGVLVTIPASALPAIKASRVPPLAAMRDVAVDRSGASRIRAVTGFVAVAGGAALTVVGAVDRSLGQAGLGALLTVVGVVLLGPVLAGPAGSVLGWPLARARGLVGSLARRNATRNPRRTAGTAAALMIGIAVVTLFTVFAASLKASVDDATERSFRGDLVMTTDNFSGSGFSPELTERIAALPEVARARALGNGVAVVDGETRELTVADTVGLGRVLDLDVRTGSFDDVRDGEVAVSSKLADEHHWRLGTALPLRFGNGSTAEARVGAIYDDRSLVADVMLPTSTWVAHATQPSATAVLIELAPGVRLTQGRAAVDVVAKEFAAPASQDREEYVESVGSNVDRLLGIVYALLALAIVIALMGIANTLALSIHERTRELGLLRAVGETRGQLRAMLRGESTVISLFGTTSGLVLGVFLAWAFVTALSSGATITTFALPAGQLLAVLVIGAVVGLLAGFRPARRAARLPVLDAVNAE
jgi:putative ABC transport system permease protein